MHCAISDEEVLLTSPGLGWGLTGSRAWLVLLQIALLSKNMQLGALQAGTVYLRNREKQVSQANCTGQGRRHGVKGEA